jgi:teichuronic acid biosynthesis glycosyltransferase TuaG
MHRISVVIPCYNVRDYVAEAIRSALSQTVLPAEIIVVDDGSTDGSDSIVAAFAPRVNLVRQKNAGPSAARNSGIRLSTGDLIAFLDADDAWEPDKLARQVTALRDHPPAVLCHTQMRIVDRAGCPGDLGWGGTYGKYDDLLLGCGVCTSSVLVHRAALFSAGLFDPLYAAAHDYDLWLKLARLGPMVPIPDPLVRYRWHSSNVSSQYLRTHRETIEIMTRHLDIARRENAAGRVALARRGLGQTRQSTARQAFVAAATSAKVRDFRPAATHLLRAIRFDPRWIASQIVGRLCNKLRNRVRRNPARPDAAVEP